MINEVNGIDSLIYKTSDTSSINIKKRWLYLDLHCLFLEESQLLHGTKDR